MALPATASSSTHKEAFLGKEEGSPSQKAEKASDAAHGQLQSKEEQRHEKGSNGDSQNSTQHRNQGKVPAAGQGELKTPPWSW